MVGHHNFAFLDAQKRCELRDALGGNWALAATPSSESAARYADRFSDFLAGQAGLKDDPGQRRPLYLPR